MSVDATPAVGPAPLASLSPSRAAEFKQCALRYRFRSIDRLPEAVSLPAARGTLVHAVLESLFALPPPQRTPQAVATLLPAAWERLRDEWPQLADEIGDGAEQTEWLESAAALVRTYFELEDPSLFSPESVEQPVETVVGDLRLRGVIDRLDIGPDDTLRVVDYKSGRAPDRSHETAVLFQLKFYALVLWRERGVVPSLRLLYLTDGESVSYTPDADELERFERTVLAIWAAIQDALATGDFRPNPGRVCTWCDFTAYCPAFGATPPPYPQDAVLTDPRDRTPSPPSSAPSPLEGQ